jgi:hypothetical protein
MDGENVQGQASGQIFQGQAAQNENPLLRFRTLLENGQEYSKKMDVQNLWCWLFLYTYIHEVVEV